MAGLDCERCRASRTGLRLLYIEPGHTPAD
jgi:hypothetical protein